MEPRRVCPHGRGMLPPLWWVLEKANCMYLFTPVQVPVPLDLPYMALQFHKFPPNKELLQRQFRNPLQGPGCDLFRHWVIMFAGIHNI